MTPRHITSLGHSFVKRVVKIREDKKFRLEQKTVVVVGKTVIYDIAAHLPILSWIGESRLDIPAQEMFIGSKAVLKKIIGIDTEDLFAAEVALPLQSSLENFKSIVVLDQLVDPGNVGSIVRSCLGLGIDGIFFVSGTVDPFNDKVLRASRGASLLIPLRIGSYGEVFEIIRRNSMNVYVADVVGKNLSSIIFTKPLALILGNETRGVSPLLQSCGERVAIPMRNTMESLNVGSAGAIFIYQIQEGRA